MMSAGRRRMWWLKQNHQEDIGYKPKEKEDEDGRFKSEGSKRRVPSEGHASGSNRTEV